MKKAIKTILDIIDLYFPVVTFVILFVFYFILILLRYFAGKSIGWMYESMYIVFAWSTVMSAAHGSRVHDTIQFNVLYEHISEKAKRIFDIIANAFLAGLFIYAMPRYLKGIEAQRMVKTATLKLSNMIVFFPFIIFVFLIIVYHVADIVCAVYDLAHPERLEKKETDDAVTSEDGGAGR